MNQKLLGLTCLGAFALAACTRESPHPATDASAPAPVTTDVNSAPAKVAPSSHATDPDFDQRAFAGTFTGRLPCADCPGIDVTLALHADGAFQLTHVYQERPDATRRMDGSWTAGSGTRVLRLDPGNKTDVEQLYTIDSHDRIVMLQADGEPIDNGLDYSLSRHPAH